MLARWDEHNQRVLERANEREHLSRQERFSFHDRSGRLTTVSVNRSGYPILFNDDLGIALAIGWLRNRFMHHGGWEVDVLRVGRLGGLKVAMIERMATRDEARARALTLAEQLSGKRVTSKPWGHHFE